MVPEPDREMFQVAELAARLESSGSMWVRIALDRTTTPPTVRYLTITDHIAGMFSQRIWDYGPLVLIETQVAAAQAAEWLAEGSGTITARSQTTEFALEELPESGRSERHPGRSNQDSEPLPVPYRRYALGNRVSLNSSTSDSGWLVGTGAPAFPDADAALIAFFFNTWAPGRSAPHEVLVARLTTPGPRIETVAFSPAEVTVQIEDPPDRSRRIVPLRLDFAIGEHRSSTEIWTHTSSATLDLPEAPTSQYWWLVLSEGHRWLDRRSADGIAESDLHLQGETPTPDDEVAAWLSIGECVFLEFKRELPPARGNSKMCRTVAAFANSDGGTLVFGIDPDEATIAPLSDRYDLARDRLTTIIEGNLTEVPPFEVRKLDTAEGLVIAVDIRRGGSPPYGVDKQKPVFYIRSNATTLPATAEQVRRPRLAPRPAQSRLPLLLINLSWMMGRRCTISLETHAPPARSGRPYRTGHCSTGARGLNLCGVRSTRGSGSRGRRSVFDEDVAAIAGPSSVGRFD